MMERPTTMRAIPGKQQGSLLPPILHPSFPSYINPDDSEISIFDARKYFNDGDNKKVSQSPVTATNNGLDRISELPPPRLSSASSSVDGYGYGNRNYRTRSFHATPTASSEASWNSQTGLLSNPPGAMAVTVRHNHHHHHNQSPVDDRRKIGSTAKRWLLLRRRCPCSGKKSVQVEEKAVPEPRIQQSTGVANLNPNSRLMINAMMKRQGSSSNTPRSNFSSSPASIDWSERREEAAAPVEVILPNVVRRISAETNHRFVAGSGLGQQGHGHRVVLTPNKDSSNGGGGGFTFPILSQAPPVKLVRKPPLSQLEDPPRESLEVFRPHPPEEKVFVSTKIIAEGRSSFTFPGSPRSRLTATEDDMASDASSDLFEIESFSTQTTGNALNRRRDSMEDASTFNARRLGGGGGGGRVYGKSVEEEEELEEEEECYEPSEASIEWSVTTAEGFDRVSVANYSEAGEELRYTMMRNRIEEEESEKKSGKKRGSGGLLLSCRCEKAVSVGPPPHVNGGGRAGAVKKPPLPVGRSRSTARLSLPFPT